MKRDKNSYWYVKYDMQLCLFLFGRIQNSLNNEVTDGVIYFTFS